VFNRQIEGAYKMQWISGTIALNFKSRVSYLKFKKLEKNLNLVNLNVKVAPVELEMLLLEHPGVADAAVIGMIDRWAGEVPKAFVVKKPDSTVSADEITSFVQGYYLFFYFFYLILFVLYFMLCTR
jgi:hypothetical protein